MSLDLEIIGITVLWTFFGYVIVASIDFGAGLINAYSVCTGKQYILTKVIQRYLSPVWEGLIYKPLTYQNLAFLFLLLRM